MAYDTYPDLPPELFFQEQTSGYTSEKELYSVLQMEAWNKYGVPIIFYPVSYNSSYDPVFGEDANRSVIRNFEIMGYYELGREDKIGTVFGLNIGDQINFFVNKDHFRVASTFALSGGTSGVFQEYKPQVGDVIKTIYNEFFYEIITVKDTDEMFERVKHSWTMVAKPYVNQHFSIEPAVGSDSISAVNTNTDIYNVSDVINNEKSRVLYQPEVGEESPKDPFGGW